MENVDVELGDIDTIQTQSTAQSLLDWVENGKKHANKLAPSIYMVPSVFRDLSPNSFKPRVVSIGPLHREDEKLQEFEVYKASSVHDLLHRFKSSSPLQTMQSCLHKVNDSIDKIKNCYDGIKISSDVELAKMMVMDGCFILEFIYRFWYDRSVVRNQLLEHYLIYDLLLLENQIPFFVLDDIFHIFLKLGSKVPLSNFILPVLEFLNLFDGSLDVANIDTDTPQHILGLLHQCYRPQNDISISSDICSSSNLSAVDLDRAGVSFKPNKDANWPLAMEVKLNRFPWLSWFWDKTTLRMPVLHIHDDTELILRNLMAYEQSSLRSVLITSYVAVMDRLVNTEEDIAMLVKSKVLVNVIGSNEEAADMMNRISKEVDWIHLYKEEWKKLDSYCNGNWPKHVAWLRRTYFNSPWNLIALLAGIVLFGLTVVQTIYATKEK